MDVVYTDGCCFSNGRDGARAGIGAYFPDYPHLNISKPLKGRATNNHAEIRAVTEAVRAAVRYGITDLRIYTDSQFVQNCVRYWIPKWEDNGWRTCAGHIVVNRNELQDMQRALDDLDDYDIVHVRGHEGHYGNEMAHKFAQEGARYYRG